MLDTIDVVVVGAGSAGAAVAGFLAAAGARVEVLERRPLGAAGASWVNGVPRAVFAATGIAPPGPGESHGAPLPVHMIGEGGRAVVHDHDLIDVDMRRLVDRLQATAAAAGARFVGEVRVEGRDGDVLRTSRGPVRARWIVDASGLAGARLLDQPAPPRERICTAVQENRAVVDRAAARAFFAARDVPVGHVCNLVGVAGGFSILNVRLIGDADAVGILTGSIPALGHPSGRAMLDRFVAEEPWIGARISGGGGPIPLGRAHARLADDQVALLGDAAGQVFPAHGSGVAAGLLAGRMLADVILAGRPLRDYEVAWQRRHGGTLASFEAVRRWNQGLDARALGTLLGSGVLDAATLRAGIDQELPRPTLAALPRQARALLGARGLAGGVVSAIARSLAVRALYAAYPRDPAAVPRWARAVDRLVQA